MIELIEYQPCRLSRKKIKEEEGEKLFHDYRNIIEVEPPSFITEDCWILTSLGWVGSIPVSPDLHINLKPKIKIQNIFGMLEYAYRLKNLKILEGLLYCESVKEFYEQLAAILSKRILDRGRKGFYKSYIQKSDQLSFISGRIDLKTIIKTPWNLNLNCNFEEHTPDVEENQILFWTLNNIIRSGSCSNQTLPIVKKAYRSLQNAATLTPFNGKICLGRIYNRLNNDYHILHSLCRFFLENSGPTYNSGSNTMLPILIDMARLFELFVAEWLKANLPINFSINVQERVTIGSKNELFFQIDMVLYDSPSGKARSVLDTKYKVTDTPSSSDISQIASYALSKGCKDAIIIYPQKIKTNDIAKVGDVSIIVVGFPLDGDLELAGTNFLNSLIDNLNKASAYH